MNQIGSSEALSRLKSLLSGAVIVEEEVLPRLVQALVRLSGQQGEELFSYYLRTEKASHMAARFASMSIMVMGTSAVPTLVEGLLSSVDLPRIRATTDVLSTLGTVEAHQALKEIVQKVRHPVGRELAATKLEELERDHPTRFILLPKLRNLAEEDPKKLYNNFLSTTDKNLPRTLLEEIPKLDGEGKRFAYRVLGEKGDLTTARFMQGKLNQPMDEEFLPHFSLALQGMISRMPIAAEDFTEDWLLFWKNNSAKEIPAFTAAKALSVLPAEPLLETYQEFLGSKFLDVRLCGYEAITVLGSAVTHDNLKKGLSSPDFKEVAAAAAALAVLGNPAPLEELAKSKSSQKRAESAFACLRAKRADLWRNLALDDERAVRRGAIDAMENSPQELRPSADDLAPVISFTMDYDSFEAICKVLGSVGDLESAKRLTSRLSDSDEHVVTPVFRVLKALRVRGIYRWEELGEEKAVLFNSIASNIANPAAVSLIGACIEDFEMGELEKIRNALLDQPASLKQGALQAVTMAVIGRIHVISSRKKVIDEIEQIIEDRPLSPRAQIEAVNRVASLWVRADLDLGRTFCQTIEDWMLAVAQDRTLARIARKAAVDAVGKAGSAQAYATLMRLRASPTEEIASAAETAAIYMARRHPNVQLEASHHDAQTKEAVLIVEDDTNIRNIFQNFLSQKGITAHCASEGEEALEILGEKHVDAILLDLHMEGMNGFTFLEALREMNNHPPVLVATSYGDRNTVLRVLKLGAVDFLRKPVDLPELLTRVRNVISGRPAI